MKQSLSPVQQNALRWYAIPAGFRTYEGQKIGVYAPRSQTIDSLVRKGFLERVPHPTAGRGFHSTQLTAAGRELIAPTTTTGAEA